jgi:hypothetical protein
LKIMGFLRAAWIWAKSTCFARGQFKLAGVGVRARLRMPTVAADVGLVRSRPGIP